jgi:OOP family OmpA-OmpF porin
MKRFFISIFLVLVALSIFAQTTSPGRAKWSLGVKGGVDIFRVSPREPIMYDFDHFVNSLHLVAPSVFIEVSPNQNYGFGIDAGYFTYDREVAGDKYFGNTIDATLFGSLNLSNIAAPCRTGFWKNVNLYANLGLGTAFYTFKRPVDNDYQDRFTAILGTAGLNAEFSLCKSLSLLVEGQYRYYTRSFLGGYVSSNQAGNDAIALNIGLRWKIGAAKKEHVRNMTNCIKPTDSEVKAKPQTDPEVINRLKSAENKNKAIENKLQQMHNENNEANEKLNKLEEELENLKNIINSNQEQSKKKVNESDAENNGETSSNLNKYYNNDNDNDDDNNSSTIISFNFNNNSFEICEDIFDLQQIAEDLKNDNSWSFIKISGHTDAVGNPEFNKYLSEKRAKFVYDYFVEKGIDAKKMSYKGYGLSSPITSNDTVDGRHQNRRVEIEIVK